MEQRMELESSWIGSGSLEANPDADPGELRL